MGHHAWFHSFIHSPYASHDRVAVGLFISLNGLGLYGKYGRPQFNSEYYMRFISDLGIIDLLLGFILIATRPYLFALGPIITKTAVFFSPQLIAYVRTNLPAAQAMIDSTIARFIPSMSNVNVLQALSQVTSRDLEMQVIMIMIIMAMLWDTLLYPSSHTHTLHQSPSSIYSIF